jgi:hypothetical protein
MFRLLLPAILTLGSLGVIVPKAGAETVTRIDGTNASYTMTSPASSPPGTFQISFDSNVTTKLNGVLLVSQPVTLITTMTFDLAGRTSDGIGGYYYNFDPSGPYVQEIEFGSGNDFFNLYGVTAEVDEGPNGSTVILKGTMQLTSNGSSYDMSPFNNPASTFLFTLNTSTTDLNELIEGGGSDGGTGSFSEKDPAAAPEPASMALLGMGALGMVGYGWRKRRRVLAMA